MYFYDITATLVWKSNEIRYYEHLSKCVVCIDKKLFSLNLRYFISSTDKLRYRYRIGIYCYLRYLFRRYV